MENNCIFCKIADGVIPSYKVYEDEDILAFLDIAPSAKGHTILIPKKHTQNLLTAETDVLATLLPAAKKVAESVKNATKCDGINLLQNNETCAGQSVFHLHFHIIPRFLDDSFTLPWKPVSYNEGEAEKLKEILWNFLQSNTQK